MTTNIIPQIHSFLAYWDSKWHEGLKERNRLRSQKKNRTTEGDAEAEDGDGGYGILVTQTEASR